jgi:Zn-dependent protease
MTSLVVWILAFVIAITVHEAAHAYMADRLGDPTPKMMGRLSLNPLVHYDPIGTTLLLVLVVMKAVGIPVIPFGWAKPVRFDPYNLKNPRRDAALISLAGPGSNLILAGILGGVLRSTSTPFSPLSFLSTALVPIIVLNVILALFNLVPVHPLDGGKILVGLLPPERAYDVDRFLKQYGIIVLFMLLFPVFGGTSPIFLVLEPALRVILGILIPGSPVV